MGIALRSRSQATKWFVYTRNGHDWTRQFRVIVDPLRSLTSGSALIDGEVVAIDQNGRSNFSMLKTGIAAGDPLKFYAFDLLELDGRDLRDLKLVDRKVMLEKLLGPRTQDDILQLSPHVLGQGQEVFEAMCRGGHEGVIAKRAGSRYVGDRTTSWLKIKCIKRQEFVVGGYRPSDSGRGMASLILGTYENGKLVYRARVGAGVTEVMRDKILAQLEKRRLSKSPVRKPAGEVPAGRQHYCARGVIRSIRRSSLPRSAESFSIDALLLPIDEGLVLNAKSSASIKSIEHSISATDSWSPVPLSSAASTLQRRGTSAVCEQFLWQRFRGGHRALDRGLERVSRGPNGSEEGIHADGKHA